MRKIALLISLALCVGLLFGCNCNKSNEDAKSDSKNKTETVKKINDESSTIPVITPDQTKKADETQKDKKKDKKKEQSKDNNPNKPKPSNKGGSLVGSWTWDGGIFVYTFKKDGTGVYTTGSEAMYFNYTTKGGKVTIDYKGEGKVTMPYGVDGNTLYMADANGDYMIYYKNKPKSKSKK